MKQVYKAAMLLMLPLAIGCSKPKELQITNNYTEGFYLIDIETAEESTPENIEKLYDEGEIQFISNGGSFEYKSVTFNIDNQFDKFEKDGKYVFCFVGDSELEKAKKLKTKAKFETVKTFEMKSLDGISIAIKNNKGNPDFELTMESEREF